MSRRGCSDGIVLIAVLAFLGLISLLAVSFARLATTDLLIAQNSLDRLRARNAADAGIERAIERLHARAVTGWFSPAGNPWAFSGDLQKGVLGFEVRVRDSQGRLHLNDGVEYGPGHAVSRNLKRMLDILGRLVDVPGLGRRLIEARPPRGYTSEAQILRALDGDRRAFVRIRDFVTVEAWSDPSVAMLVPLSRAETRAYPVLPDRPRDPRTGAPVFRRGRGVNRWGEPMDDRWPLRFLDPRWRETPWRTAWAAAVWTWRSLNPLWIETVRRSPVNVNTAPREVLLALLADLEGFFLSERRRPIPFNFGYAFLGQQVSYDPDRSSRTLVWSRKGGELGFLYRSYPIRIFGEPDGLDGRLLADEIIACREGKPSPGVRGLDYGRAPFGGPFRSWNQFDEFLRCLVEAGLIRDPRRIFFDYAYRPPAAGRTWSIELSSSPGQQREASEAIADVLLANFNPNLHLNELNPDAPLRLRVDKTDLLVQSTELCFVPMGRFEIESTGRMKMHGEVVTEEHIATRVRLYDAVRIGIQSRLGRGRLVHAEHGPEPGAASLDCDWGGYVRPATRTGRGRADVYEGFRRFMEHPERPEEPSVNLPAPGERKGGPYGPPEHLQVHAGEPADLRPDGAYFELHRAYGIPVPPSPFERFAAFAFWVKPSWSSRRAGKIRKFFSWSDTRWRTGIRLFNLPARLLPLPFGLVFLPAWQGPRDPYVPPYMGDPRRASLVFAMGLDMRFGGRGGGLAAVGPSMDRGITLEPGRWTHIVVSVDRDAPEGARIGLWVDGRRLPGTSEVAVHLGKVRGRLGDVAGPSIRIGGEYSALGASGPVPRFDFADATIDEFHAWFDRPWAVREALRLFDEGRFFEEGLYESCPVELPGPSRRLPPSAGSSGDPVPQRRPELLAVSWTVRPGEAPEIYALEESDGAQRRSGPLPEPGWSPFRPVRFEVPAETRKGVRIVKIRVRLAASRTRAQFLDDFTIFYLPAAGRHRQRVTRFE